MENRDYFVILQGRFGRDNLTSATSGAAIAPRSVDPAVAVTSNWQRDLIFGETVFVFNARIGFLEE